jgi:hypothetical protein
MGANSIFMRIIAAKETLTNNSGKYPQKNMLSGFFPDYAAIFRDWLDQYWKPVLKKQVMMPHLFPKL